MKKNFLVILVRPFKLFGWFFAELWRYFAYKIKVFHRQYGFWGFLTFRNKVFLVLIILLASGGVFYGGMRYERYENKRQVGLAISPSGPSRLLAQNSSSKTSSIIPIRYDGDVMKIDDKAVTIKDTNGKTGTFTFDPKMTVTSSGKPAKVDMIKLGDTIRLYTKSGAGNSQITNRISILPKK